MAIISREIRKNFHKIKLNAINTNIEIISIES